jgi:hypothetical protein
MAPSKKTTKSPLEKLSTPKLLADIRKRMKQKLQEIGFEPAEAGMEKPKRKPRQTAS